MWEEIIEKNDRIILEQGWQGILDNETHKWKNFIW